MGMSYLKIIVVFLLQQMFLIQLIMLMMTHYKPLNFINFHHHSCIMCFYWQKVWRLWKISCALPTASMKVMENFQLVTKMPYLYDKACFCISLPTLFLLFFDEGTLQKRATLSTFQRNTVLLSPHVNPEVRGSMFLWNISDTTHSHTLWHSKNRFNTKSE